ncbi:MAG TPA: hypothetical protein VF422_06665 [Dokdonella sp.]
MVDWSLVLGLTGGLGLPALGGLFIIVRMENRVTQLEKDRESDQHWREQVTTTLSAIARDVNQLIGANKVKL